MLAVEPDLPSELGSALGDQDVDIPEPWYEEEVEHFASGFTAMASVEGQSSAVPAAEPIPNPGQSEQPSAPVSQPVVGLQQQLTLKSVAPTSMEAENLTLTNPRRFPANKENSAPG
ncbi:hypothetical protein PISMIDRAFT_12802 [Pisolithus microcarpus 441]|uniref:Uncharacterized protein n=1 Tax=Pisolithus microcarpus 441 TaxID=765257 RepID=A0A0C9Z3B9_9AGAM|nr:hypothetical protein PISMIDRAFT_12802 [Pisolithus microcarpus 441]